MLNQDVKSVLSVLIPSIRHIFHDDFEMFCLYGAACDSDFTPYYDCIQFDCLLKTPLSGNRIESLFALRERFEAEKAIAFSRLSGVFISTEDAGEPGEVTGLYWGPEQSTLIDKWRISAFEKATCLSQGIIAEGSDLRNQNEMPSPEALLEDISDMIASMKAHSTVRTAEIHEIEALFQLAQALCWLVTGSVKPRIRAAEWCVMQPGFGTFSHALGKALEMRKFAYLAEFQENKDWLYHLDIVIFEACNLVEQFYSRSAFFEDNHRDERGRRND
jgi:hypothetical protein